MISARFTELAVLTDEMRLNKFKCVQHLIYWMSRELSVDNVYLTKSFYWLSTYDLIIERMNQVKQ